MTSPDYDVLMNAQNELQVKLIAAGAAQDVVIAPASGTDQATGQPTSGIETPASYLPEQAS